MDCRETQKKLSEYLDGYIIEEEKRQFEKHLKKCPICTQELENIKDALSTLKQLPEVDPPTNFENELKNKLNQVEINQRKNKRFKIPRWLSWGVAIILIILVSNGILGINSPNKNQRSDSFIDIAKNDKNDSDTGKISTLAENALGQNRVQVKSATESNKPTSVRENEIKKPNKEKTLDQKSEVRVNNKNIVEDVAEFTTQGKNSATNNREKKPTRTTEEQNKENSSDVAIMSFDSDKLYEADFYTLSFDITVDNLPEAIDFIEATIKKYRIEDYHLEKDEDGSVIYISLSHDITSRLIADIHKQYNFDMKQISIVSESKDKTLTNLELHIIEKK